MYFIKYILKRVWLMFILLKSVNEKKNQHLSSKPMNQTKNLTKKSYSPLASDTPRYFCMFGLPLDDDYFWATSIWSWKKLVTQICRVIHYYALDTFRFCDMMQVLCLCVHTKYLSRLKHSQRLLEVTFGDRESKVF